MTPTASLAALAASLAAAVGGMVCPTQEETAEYSFERLGFAITLPAGWKMIRSGGGAIWMGRTADGSPCAVTVIATPLGGLDPGELLVVNKKAMLALGGVVEDHRLEGGQAILVLEMPKESGWLLHRWTLIAAGGGRIYSLVCVARYSAYAELADVFSRILESLRLL